MSREVYKIVSNNENTMKGGAKLRHIIASTSEVPDLDPFILLDEFNADGASGFPDHPHRGFEAISYVLQGSFKHEDFNGHKGIIRAGDLQWLTAGKGIVHSETPQYNESTHVRALQLWINLSQKNKMIEPSYQFLAKSTILRKITDGVRVKVIAGESMGIKSSLDTLTPTYFLDFKLEKNAQFTQPIPQNWNAFIYILDGSGVFGNKKPLKADKSQIIVFTNGDSISFRNERDDCILFYWLVNH